MPLFSLIALIKCMTTGLLFIILSKNSSAYILVLTCHSQYHQQSVSPDYPWLHSVSDPWTDISVVPTDHVVSSECVETLSSAES